ncbi:major facilitator superfamily domain-containing protein [Phlebopus sp. FC_14]|nr:major facilitator superfamily domain-containing protein [Phlebopus sp. FC_14]
MRSKSLPKRVESAHPFCLCARIDGLVTDLHISAPGYNTALAVYFIGYVIFEIPADVRPGIVSICQGIVSNQAGLLCVRFFLGAAEAGLFPGVVYVFSLYYRRCERSWRVAIFFGGAALAGAFGGILAFAIGLMDGVSGRRGWQWIFIIEGALTAAISLAAYFIVPTWSHKAKFLSETERVHLLERLRADSDVGTHQSFQWSGVRSAFEDHLVWAYAFLFHGFSFVLYSFSLFLPTIVAGLGFQAWQAQLMTVPPNVVATLSIWGTVWLSSKWGIRAPFIIASAVVTIIGYTILVTAETPGVQYFGVHLAAGGCSRSSIFWLVAIVAAGVCTGDSLLLSWPGENVSGQSKRAVAVALQITIGDIGAIAGCLVYRPSLSSHLYRKPNLIAIGYLVFAILVTVYLWAMMARENRRREQLLAENVEILPELVTEDKLRLGDRSVYYTYQL